MERRLALRLAGKPEDMAGPDEITFIGTATTLIRVGGFSILTDPNFLHRGDRAYLGPGVSSRRLTEPALSIRDLPDLDFIVLSHHRGDHFDRIAARDLDHDLPVITEPHAARKLISQGFRSPVALSTWQSRVITRGDAEVRVTSLPGRHAPKPLGFLVPPVMGALLEFSRDGEQVLRMYITGNTIMHDGIIEIADRFPDIDLCLIHLGGARVGGILLSMDARQGVEALRAISPRNVIPIHYDDYTLFKSPLSEFMQAMADANIGCNIHCLDRGEKYRLTVGAPEKSDKPNKPGAPRVPR
jgi:L-ascorbate metabolism protein UlaG (beta-lactamase superfamily)